MLDSIVKIALINIGLSIPIYFFFKWLFGKFDFKERSKIYLSVIGAITTPWIVFITLIVVLMFAVTYYPKRDFNQAQWISSPRTRYELADDLIDRKILLGKTKTEVRELLGNEEGTDEDYGGYRIQNSEDSDDWEYFIGFKPAPMRIDAGFLEIKFSNEKVVDAHLASQ